MSHSDTDTDTYVEGSPSAGMQRMAELLDAALRQMAPGYDPPSAGMGAEPGMTVRKASAYVPLSMELALDHGLVTEEQARATGWVPRPAPRISRRRRMRWRWQSFRERLGRGVGGWIAGVDLSERDE